MSTSKMASIHIHKYEFQTFVCPNFCPNNFNPNFKILHPSDLINHIIRCHAPEYHYHYYIALSGIPEW